MVIKSKHPATPGSLFHAVGQDWRGRFIVMFLQTKVAEAVMIMDGIIPYLQADYGDQVLQFF